MLCDCRYLTTSSRLLFFNMESNMVMISRFSSTACFMVPDIYCMLISSTDDALPIFKRRATLPDCFDESAAATELGTKFSSATA